MRSEGSKYNEQGGKGVGIEEVRFGSILSCNALSHSPGLPYQHIADSSELRPMDSADSR